MEIKIEDENDINYIVEGRYFKTIKKNMMIYLIASLSAIMIAMVVDNNVFSALAAGLAISYFGFIIRHIYISRKRAKQYRLSVGSK